MSAGKTFVFTLPDGVKAEDLRFTYCTGIFEMVPIPGTPFSKLVPVEQSLPQPEQDK